MRLQLDENISWRLTAYLRPHCVAVLHVHDISLAESPDTSIWRYARQHGYDVLTNNEDFVWLVLAEGFPPRIEAVQNAQVTSEGVGVFPAGAIAPVSKDFWVSRLSLECCNCDYRSCESFPLPPAL